MEIWWKEIEGVGDWCIFSIKQKFCFSCAKVNVLLDQCQLYIMFLKEILIWAFQSQHEVACKYFLINVYSGMWRRCDDSYLTWSNFETEKICNDDLN